MNAYARRTARASRRARYYKLRILPLTAEQQKRIEDARRKIEEEKTAGHIMMEGLAAMHAEEPGLFEGLTNAE